MKLAISLSLVALVLPALSAPLDLKRQTGVPDAATITRLAPDLGFTAGLNPTGSGDCDGAVNGPDGKPIKVPCSCPPAPDVYIPALIKNVQAGFAVNNPTVKVSFPTGDSKQDKSARVTAASITIQNLNGPGKGCPFASTRLGALQQAINSRTDDSNGPPANNPPAAGNPPANNTTPANNSNPTNSPPANSTPANPTPANNTPPSGTPDAATITRLAPELGFHSGVNPTGTGDCDGAINGADGKPIKIPCSCPPAQGVYISQLIANVQAGKALNNPTVLVSFPAGDSKADKSARLNAASITLQNLNGPGKGCPVVSTTFPIQQKAVDAETDVASTPSNLSINSQPAPAPPSNANPNGDNTGAPDAATIRSLAPELGFQSGVNPTGTGDCDGAVNGADGKPIKIPCSCPPPQNVYLDALVKNVQAGIAVNNPSVRVTFPTDNSNQSQSARITAALITLQNLNGPGKGCPAASTTLVARQKALAT